jgi:hypothetical protein
LLSSCEQYSIEESKDSSKQFRKMEGSDAHEDDAIDWLLYDLQEQDLCLWRLYG